MWTWKYGNGCFEAEMTVGVLKYLSSVKLAKACQMTIQIDDLLPTNDGAFIPPDSGSYFDAGSPFWEIADYAKWGDTSAEWKAGYYAALFECALKSGRPFIFPIFDESWMLQFCRRVESYRRAFRQVRNKTICLCVGGHVDE
jgi:hypothetical protein